MGRGKFRTTNGVTSWGTEARAPYSLRCMYTNLAFPVYCFYVQKFMWFSAWFYEHACTPCPWIKILATPLISALLIMRPGYPVIGEEARPNKPNDLPWVHSKACVGRLTKVLCQSLMTQSCVNITQDKYCVISGEMTNFKSLNNHNAAISTDIHY